MEAEVGEEYELANGECGNLGDEHEKENLEGDLIAKNVD